SAGANRAHYAAGIEQHDVFPFGRPDQRWRAVFGSDSSLPLSLGIAQRRRGTMQAHLRHCSVFLTVGFCLATAVPRPSEARVVRFVVEQRRPFNNGSSWGATGPYERLDGTAYMEVNPRDPLNAVIVNLDKAPRNGRGMLEFSAPFFILKPVDMLRGNHKIYYAINNRGNKSGLLSLPPAALLPSTNNPLFYDGDGLQLRLGYTIVDAGWQGDVAAGGDRLFPNFPVATQPDGSPIVSNVRIEYSDRTIPQQGTFTLNLEGNSSFV